MNESFSDFSELINTVTPSQQEGNNPNANKNNFNSFEISQIESITNSQNGNDIVPSNNKKRTAEDLFGDITDLDNDFFFEAEIPVKKKTKTTDIEEQLVMIEQILELRRLAKEKNSILRNKDSNTVLNKLNRDKHNLSYRVPKYPFVGVTRFDKERVYVRFHSEEYEKEEMQRIVNESTFSGVMGEAFKEVWRDAQKLVGIVKNVFR